MIKLINKSKRQLGIPSTPALILNAGQDVEISAEQLTELQKNRTVIRWLHKGMLAVDGKPSSIKQFSENWSKPVQEVVTDTINDLQPYAAQLPDGITGVGIELHHKGDGWWRVYVNGFEVTDEDVRKKKAREIAAEYE